MDVKRQFPFALLVPSATFKYLLHFHEMHITVTITLPTIVLHFIVSDIKILFETIEFVSENLT